MEHTAYIQQLFNKYLRNECSREEAGRLMQLAAQPQYEGLLMEMMREIPVDETDPATLKNHQDAVREIIGRLMAEIGRTETAAPEREIADKAAWEKAIADKAAGPGQTTTYSLPESRKSWFRYSAAATIIVLIVTAGYLLLFPSPAKETLSAMGIAGPPEPQPGTEGAILTLGDGSTIVLDSLGNGLVATQSNTPVALHNGQLAYDPARNNTGEVVYNTLTTPRGRQFQLILGDGTKIWLNSASSLRYPVNFGEKERKVEITGEAYFEVFKDKNRRFVITAGAVETVVLGTRLNINAYVDEPAVKTTLLEGSVLVKSGAHEKKLLPGQQASCAGINQDMWVNTVNTEDVTAWKNGFFNFNNADIRTVMRSLARWYDLDIMYQGTPAPVQFKGKIQRNLSLADVLEFLKTDIRFEREGNKIIIKP